MRPLSQLITTCLCSVGTATQRRRWIHRRTHAAVHTPPYTRRRRRMHADDKQQQPTVAAVGSRENIAKRAPSSPSICRPTSPPPPKCGRHHRHLNVQHRDNRGRQSPLTTRRFDTRRHPTIGQDTSAPTRTPVPITTERNAIPALSAAAIPPLTYSTHLKFSWIGGADRRIATQHQ